MRHARLIGPGGTWRKVKVPKEPADVPEEPGWELMSLHDLAWRTQTDEPRAGDIACAR